VEDSVPSLSLSDSRALFLLDLLSVFVCLLFCSRHVLVFVGSPRFPHFAPRLFGFWVGWQRRQTLASLFPSSRRPSACIPRFPTGFECPRPRPSRSDRNGKTGTTRRNKCRHGYRYRYRGGNRCQPGLGLTRIG